MLGSAASVLAGIPADIPVDIGRGEARELARRELTAQVYRDAEPSLWERASTWAWEHFNELLAKAGSAVGGLGWVLLLVVLVVAVVVVIAWRAGWVERRHRRQSAVVFEDLPASAAEHRRRADHAADLAQWDTAVVESFRALVRDLEERGWLDARPGRTADEAAREAGRHFSDAAGDLAAAAAVFDEVAYGGRDGSREAFELVRATDDRVRSLVPGSVR